MSLGFITHAAPPRVPQKITQTVEDSKTENDVITPPIQQNSIIERFLYVIVMLVALVLITSPWTQHVARLLSVSTYERESMKDVCLYLATKFGPSFQLGALPFVIGPLAIVGLRALVPNQAQYAYSWAIVMGKFVSIATFPLLFLHVPDREDENPVGRVFAFDLVQMWCWHFTLVAYGELPPSSFFWGPLYGLCLHLQSPPGRRSSLLLAFVVVYTSLGGLYDAYLDSKTEIFSSADVPLDMWHGYEWYAAITVIYGFVVLFMSTPIPTKWWSVVDAVFYLILVNANVAAGWIAVRGWKRGEALRMALT